MTSPSRWARQLSGEQDVPVRVRQPLTESDWRAVARLRAQRYREFIPTFIAYDGPEPGDYAPSVRTLMAEHTVSGELLGTMRYRDTTVGREACGWPVRWLPDAMAERGTYAFAERLVLARHAGSAVTRLLLFKAWGLLALAHGVTFLACQTRPQTEPPYRRMGFADPQDGPLVVYDVPGFPGVPNRLLVLRSAHVREAIAQVMGPGFVACEHQGLSQADIEALPANRDTAVFRERYLHSVPVPCEPPDAPSATHASTAA
jgi:hypothetical protein